MDGAIAYHWKKYRFSCIVNRIRYLEPDYTNKGIFIDRD